MTLYTPTPTYHTAVTIADDSAAPTASAFNPGLEGALDNTAFLYAHMFNGTQQLMTATGSFVVPDGVLGAILEGFGGGGGGGNGATGPNIGANADDKGASGGGGGGGAIARTIFVALFAGEQYDVTIGAGGNAALNGGDTIITRHSTGDVVATFRGAGKGSSGVLLPSLFQASVSGPSQVHFDTALGTGGITAYDAFGFGLGGQPVRASSTLFLTESVPSLYRNYGRSEAASAGGVGHTANWGSTTPHLHGQGNASPQGYDGGLGAMPGTDDTIRGGGGGGGGGGGPGGVGALAGVGGNANNSGTGAAGAAGSNALDNTGAGGGGGGGGGGGSSSGAAGAGGKGGSGRLTVTFLRGAV